MKKSNRKIGKNEHEVEEVSLSARHHQLDSGPVLEVSLFADSRDLSQAGFAINCLMFPGLQQVEDLQGKEFVIGTNDADELNDLGESVMCRPGEVLEIDSLRLVFDRLCRDGIPVKMEALCHSDGESAIAVSGNFVAKIKGRPA